MELEKAWRESCRALISQLLAGSLLYASTGRRVDHGISSLT